MTLRRNAEAVLFAYPVLGHLIILSSNSSVAKRHILRTYPADIRRVIAVCSCLDLQHQRHENPGVEMLHDASASGEVWAVAGGVPGRAGGELIHLEQEHVGPAAPCQT